MLSDSEVLAILTARLELCSLHLKRGNCVAFARFLGFYRARDSFESAQLKLADARFCALV